jgi:hypothetical protein
MTALRFTMTVFTSIVAAVLVLAVIAAVTAVATVSTGHDMHVPGFVHVNSGSGTVLATASADPGLPAWFATITVVILGLEICRLRGRQRSAA